MKMTSFEGRIKSVSTKEFENEKRLSDKIIDNLAIYFKANGHRIHVSDKIYLENCPGSFMDKTKLIICLKESLGPDFDCYISEYRFQHRITIEIIKQFGNIKSKDDTSHDFVVDLIDEKQSVK